MRFNLLYTGGLFLAFSSMNVTATDWQFRGFAGISITSDFNARGSGFAQEKSAVDIALGSGFNTGLGVGFEVHPSWVIELAWEYRTNDSRVEFVEGDVFEDGNYASNIFFLNGIYYLKGTERWRPYAGLGWGCIQEIDIDREGLGDELSYSGSGDSGIQGFMGLMYKLNSRIALEGELRYGSFSDITLAQEGGGSQSFDSMEYRPITIQFGLVSEF